MDINKEFIKLKNIFRLLDWDIDLIQSSVLTSLACVYKSENSYRAEINISSYLGDEEKLKGLIHELIHIVLRDTQDMARDAIKDDTLIKIYTKQMERETEKLTQIIFNLYWENNNKLEEIENVK